MHCTVLHSELHSPLGAINLPCTWGDWDILALVIYGLGENDVFMWNRQSWFVCPRRLVTGAADPIQPNGCKLVSCPRLNFVSVLLEEFGKIRRHKSWNLDQSGASSETKLQRTLKVQLVGVVDFVLFFLQNTCLLKKNFCWRMKQTKNFFWQTKQNNDKKSNFWGEIKTTKGIKKCFGSICKDLGGK